MRLQIIPLAGKQNVLFGERLWTTLNPVASGDSLFSVSILLKFKINLLSKFVYVFRQDAGEPWMASLSKVLTRTHQEQARLVNLRYKKAQRTGLSVTAVFFICLPRLSPCTRLSRATRLH